MSENSEFPQLPRTGETKPGAAAPRNSSPLAALAAKLTARKNRKKMAVLIALAAVMAVLFVISRTSGRLTQTEENRAPYRMAAASAYPASGAADSVERARMEERKEAALVGIAVAEKSSLETQSGAAAPATVVPLIARSAELSIVVKEAGSARSDLDGILSRFRGYVGQLSETGEPGEKTLEATIHIPAGQLDLALLALRNLGRVTRESQTGEDVTMKHADLVARLGNSRETERRLLEILRTRTGKVSDVLEVEERISSTRDQIEQMEADRKVLDGRVSFATITVSLAEDFRAQFSSTSSAGSRLRNAFIGGIRDAREMVLSILSGTIAVAPSGIVWILILFFPLRWAWRRFRLALAGD